MNKTFKSVIGVGAFIASIACVPHASATLIMSFQVGDFVNSSSWCLADQNFDCVSLQTNPLGQLPDQDPAVGVASFSVNAHVGNVIFSELRISLTEGQTSRIDLSIDQIINNSTNNAASVFLTVTGTGSREPVTSISRSASGTWNDDAGGASADFFFVLNTSDNLAGHPHSGTDRPGIIKFGLPEEIGTDGESFSIGADGTLGAGFDTPGTFTLTLGLDLLLPPDGAALLNLRQTQILGQSVGVPEPASLGLLGLGLVGLALSRRKRT